MPNCRGKKPIRGKGGITYLPDLSVKEALGMDNISGLIIPGGYNDNQPEELSILIQKLHSEKKLLAAICRGPSYLARAGVLQESKYTTTYSEKLVKKLGVIDPFNRNNFLDQNIVRDDHIITAKGNAFVDFAMEILDFFDEFENPEKKKEDTEYWKGL